MHRFKRLYLLLAIIFSYTVPCVVVQETVIPGMFTKQLIQTGSNLIAQAHLADPMNWQLAAMYIYWLISILFFSRFVYNLYKFASKVIASKRRNYQKAILVLQEEDQSPHSFLRYIFIGKGIFDNRETEKEILYHELAHVRQRHSYDILFIELMRCLLWCNPFLYYYKKSIQLNHEFLADESVINSFGNIHTYQRLLLEKASSHGTNLMASRFDFGMTKKRLVMMGRSTTGKTILYKQLLLLPVILLSVYLFGQHVEIKGNTLHAVQEVAAINMDADNLVQTMEKEPGTKDRPAQPAGKPVQTGSLTKRLSNLESITVKQEAGLSRLSPLSTGTSEVKR